MSKIQSEEGTA